MMKIPVSVVIPTFNEGRFIEGCLQSVAWADEVIVVDGGSQDRTLEIAKKYATKVISADNAPAETQRLKGLQEIGNAWFLLLDADERVSQDLQDKIKIAIRAPVSKVAFFVLRRNYYQGKPVRLHHPDYQMRLFHKSQIQNLPNQIHRIPKIQGDTGILEGELVHRFFTSIPDYLNKLNRYTAIESSYRADYSRKLGALEGLKLLVWKPCGRFMQYYFLKKGYQDGFFGLFYSISSAYYDFVIAATLLIKPDKSDQ